MNLRDTYNEIAIDFYEEHVNATWWKEAANAFISFLPKNGSVLDLGCGAGYKSKFLDEHGFAVTSLDFSKSMLAIAKKRLPGGTFICADIFDELPLETQFDGIFAEAVFLHVPKKDADATLQNVVKHLKSGGYCYISLKEVREGIEEEVKKEEKYGKSFERFFSYFTINEMRDLLKRSGFEIVYEKLYPEDTRWLQVIGKKASS